uniref:RRM domain-containing protein n=1 Tax=Macrostomum lignano TaxID=282301 RepID=A0A1I8F3X3_9PLAT
FFQPLLSRHCFRLSSSLPARRRSDAVGADCQRPLDLVLRDLPAGCQLDTVRRALGRFGEVASLYRVGFSKAGSTCMARLIRYQPEAAHQVGRDLLLSGRSQAQVYLRWETPLLPPTSPTLLAAELSTSPTSAVQRAVRDFFTSRLGRVQCLSVWRDCSIAVRLLGEQDFNKEAALNLVGECLQLAPGLSAPVLWAPGRCPAMARSVLVDFACGSSGCWQRPVTVRDVHSRFHGRIGRVTSVAFSSRGFIEVWLENDDDGQRSRRRLSSELAGGASNWLPESNWWSWMIPTTTIAQLAASAPALSKWPCRRNCQTRPRSGRSRSRYRLLNEGQTEVGIELGRSSLPASTVQLTVKNLPFGTSVEDVAEALRQRGCRVLRCFLPFKDEAMATVTELVDDVECSVEMSVQRRLVGSLLTVAGVQFAAAYGATVHRAETTSDMSEALAETAAKSTAVQAALTDWLNGLGCGRLLRLKVPLNFAQCRCFFFDLDVEESCRKSLNHLVGKLLQLPSSIFGESCQILLTQPKHGLPRTAGWVKIIDEEKCATYEGHDSASAGDVHLKSRLIEALQSRFGQVLCLDTDSTGWLVAFDLAANAELALSIGRFDLDDCRLRLVRPETGLALLRLSNLPPAATRTRADAVRLLFGRDFLDDLMDVSVDRHRRQCYAVVDSRAGATPRQLLARLRHRGIEVEVTDYSSNQQHRLLGDDNKLLLSNLSDSGTDYRLVKWLSTYGRVLRLQTPKPFNGQSVTTLLSSHSARDVVASLAAKRMSMHSITDVNKPLWDQSTFWGRLRHFAWLTDPRSVFASRAKLEASRDLILACRSGAVDPRTVPEAELIRAKQLFESAYHPDSGELQNLVGRMSFQVPGGMALTGALMAFYRTTAQ